jgi:hypothetical protein
MFTKRLLRLMALIAFLFVMHSDVNTQSARLIQGSDLQWVGAIRMPSETDSGMLGLAARWVGDQLRFFSVDKDGLLWEFDYPGYGNYDFYNRSSDGTALAGEVFKNNWGDFTGRFASDVHILDSFGNPPGEDNNYLPNQGLFWSPTHQVLYWGYESSYNTGTIPWDPSVGFTEVPEDVTQSLTVHGPWWFADALGGAQASGHFCEVPARILADNPVLNNFPICVGTTGQTGAAKSSSNGPSLYSIQADLRFTPPWDVATSGSVPTIPFIGFSSGLNQTAADRGERDGCYLGHGDQYVQPTDATQGSWNELDGSNGGGNQSGSTMLWIDTPTRHGVLFFATMAQGDVWYGSGQDFGQPPPESGGPSGNPFSPGDTSHGPQGIGYKSTVFIYDPAALLQVANGFDQPNQPRISDMRTLGTYNLQPMPDGIPQGDGDGQHGINQIAFAGGTQPRHVGAYYDPTLNLIFVLTNQADYYDGAWHDVINVFALN